MDDLNRTDAERSKASKPLGWDAAWIDRISESLAGIQYGSVQIVIHDGRIVQIERTEKRRFDGTGSVAGTLPAKSGQG